MLRRSAPAILIAAFVMPAVSQAQQPVLEKANSMAEVKAASLNWTAPSIPGFIPGMELAVVSGDPGKEGSYTIRLRFPDGYMFPAHFHPKDEHLTVLSGTFVLGMGDKTNTTALKTYTAGDYLLLPGTMPHFGGAKGVTVIQLHGTGPFDIKVVEQIAGAVK